jgi:hypothetical protein
LIIFDLNQIAVASVMVQAAPKHGVMPGSDILRHMIMDSVRMNVAQFKSFNKPVVIASDGRASWRKDIFKYYKFKRPEERAKLAPNVDWKVIYVGALVKHYHAQNQFDGIMIISGDKDFKQLHYDSRIRQYSPVLKDYVKSEGAEIERKKIILSGDRLDGVPNVLSPDNSFADKIRQRKLMPKIKAELMAYASPDDIREAVIKRNYYRNMVLTDLNMTPKDIRADIIEQFETKRNKLPPTMKVFNYLVSKQLVELSSKAGDFII